MPPPGQRFERPRRVWLHLSPFVQPDMATGICDAILDRDADLQIVVSARGTVPVLPSEIETTALPGGGRAAIGAFLDRIAPSVVGWTDGQAEPGILRELDHRAIPVHLFDSGNAIEASRVSLSRRIFRSSPLRYFTSISAGDAATKAALIRAGARDGQIEVRGVLERGPDPLACAPGLREHFAEMLVARPIWLAALINSDELDLCIAAHLQLLRRSHRVLMILAPGRTEDADRFAAVAAEAGLSVRRRSLDEEPDAETQVYLADRRGEMGLWYRLAPVSFIGRTLAGPTADMPDPFDAAALGSVVLHGPATQPHFANFTRLARADAARAIAGAGDLAQAIETLLAPDKAAAMAQAAWDISTSGSNALDHAVGLIVRSAHAEWRT